MQTRLWDHRKKRIRDLTNRSRFEKVFGAFYDGGLVFSHCFPTPHLFCWYVGIYDFQGSLAQLELYCNPFSATPRSQTFYHDFRTPQKKIK